MSDGYEWWCESPDDLQRLGHALGALQPMGVCIALLGDLGAGKTTFTQGLGLALGVSEEVTSPTFALMVEYDAPCPLVHVDAYRLAPGESEGIGLEETLEAWPGVAVVEWADLVLSDLPESCIFVRISIHDEGRLVEAWSAVGALDSWLRRWKASL